MNRKAHRLVNLITLYRLTSAPMLIVLLFFGQVDIFKWLLALSFVTDAIDGWLARRYSVTTVSGARIDSVADDLTVFAAILGIVFFRPDFLRAKLSLVIIMAVFYLMQNSIALIRYGKPTSFHTYTAKFAAVSQGIFLMQFYLFSDPVPTFFEITAILTLAGLAEEILLVLLLPKWQSDVKGLYWVLKNGGSYKR